MKRVKTLPIIITLTAAFISCLASIIEDVTLEVFTFRLLGTVVCFGFLGIIARVVIERFFMSEPEIEQEEIVLEEENPAEDISSEATEEK